MSPRLRARRPCSWALRCFAEAGWRRGISGRRVQMKLAGKSIVERNRCPSFRTELQLESVVFPYRQA